ncbi:MAG TPA: ABC transporter substrate-binding protein [Gemmatimonadaceae bacterium]|nr:ABC transporter substrate-binding protein [Gemmatimonadaceae bacterium]
MLTFASTRILSRANAVRRRFCITSISALFLATTVACSDQTDGVVLGLYKFQENYFGDVVARCNEAAAGRYTIEVHVLPRAADGQREQLVRRLAARDESMDILGLDVTWIAEFAEAGWILPWTGADSVAAVEGLLPGPLATMTWEDTVFAVASHTNVQLLWYRSDLVPDPPETWDEMLDIADSLAAAGAPHVIAFTGAQYEGLVVGFNTLVESFGGTLLSDDGTRSAVDERTVRALELLRRFATSAGASPALGNSHEAEAQAQMENGYAAFELNWPYVAAAMRENNPAMVDDFAFTTYPAVVPGQPARVTTGGLDYAVGAYSRQPEFAREAILCLRSRENQKFMMLNNGTPPSFRSLYDDPSLKAAYPMLDVIRETLDRAVSRPKTPFYQNVSTVVADVLSPLDRIDPSETAKELDERIQAALESRGLLP